MNTIPAERLHFAVAQIAPEIQTRLRYSGNMRTEEPHLSRELTCCVLSSQVPYDMAVAASERLDHEGLLDNSTLLCGELLEERILKVLMHPLEFAGKSRRYRFPRSKARQLADTLLTIRRRYGTVAALLESYRDPLSVRVALVEHLPGIGPKQASMFLRNVGASYSMAIIDRHVLRYMLLTGLCRSFASPPVSLCAYEEQEKHLCSYAEELGYSVGIVDWAIWIVMRAAATLDKT
jgi:N-glycosylase/DNA lyase